MKEILSLARLTGKTSEELEALLFEQGELKKEWDSEFSNLVLDNFKDKERRAKDDHYRRGQKEKAEVIEAAIKPVFSHFGIESTRIEEGLAQLAEKVAAEPPPGGPGDLTPEQLRNHPNFAAAAAAETASIKKKMDALKAEAEAAKQEKEQYISQQQARLHAEAIKARARATLKELGANFGTDEEKAIDAFLAIYPASRFQDAEGSPIPLGPEGQPLTDKYGDPISFQDFLKEKWFIGFSQDNTKTPAPPPKGAPGGAKKYFASEQAYNELKDKAAAAGDWNKVKDLDKQYLEQVNNGGFM